MSKILVKKLIPISVQTEIQLYKFIYFDYHLLLFNYLFNYHLSNYDNLYVEYSIVLLLTFPFIYSLILIFSDDQNIYQVCVWRSSCYSSFRTELLLIVVYRNCILMPLDEWLASSIKSLGWSRSVTVVVTLCNWYNLNCVWTLLRWCHKYIYLQRSVITNLS